MTRRSLAVLLAATLVLAGCTVGPGTTTEEQPGQGDAEATPPGVSDGRLANATALLHAHETALAESGFAATMTRSTNGTAVSTFDVVAGPSMATYELTWTRSADGGDAVETRLWANESERFVRTRADGETSYRVVPREEDSLGVLESLRSYVAAGNFTVADERSDAGHAVLTADAVDARTGADGPFRDAESFDGRAVVDDRGRVHELNVTVERPSGTETVTFELRRTGVASVERPGWVSDVPPGVAVAPQLSVDVDADRYLVVSNEGGDAVPRNATLSLTTNGSTYRATFDAPLEPGEVRYAAIATDDGRLRLAAERPDPGTVETLTSPVSVAVETAAGASLYSASMGWGSSSAAESGSGSSSASGDESGSGSESASGSSTETPTG